MRSTRYEMRAVALAVWLAFAAFAQGTGSGSTSETSTTETYADSTRRDNDLGFDWGWLGLIGLAGLMGLMGLCKQPDVHRTDAARASMAR